MKTFFCSLAMAFSMYSRIPVPAGKRSERNSRLTLCFFPLVGACVGFFVMLWLSIAWYLGFGSLVKAAVVCVIPVLVTGGIHMDGFLDTVDALSSHKSRLEMLDILKDPHCGAFAVIYGLVYFILYFAMWTDLSLESALLLSIGFVLSRALSALAAVTFVKAKKGGMLNSVARREGSRLTAAVSLLYIVLCAVSFAYISWRMGVFIFAGALIAFIVYRVVAYTRFGGITGDLAGYFVCLCELFMAISAQIGEHIWCL